MGLFSFAAVPLHPPQPWDGSTIPSQQGKVAIVTGANSGIGFYTARKLVERGAHVVLACRNESRGIQAETEMTQFLQETQSNGKVEFMQVDLASLASVRAFAEAFQQRGFTKLDLLVNNAGLACPAQERTEDGFETQFQVNHLSHFYLASLLFPLLQASPSSRVVAVSSLAHRVVRDMDFETLATGTNLSFSRYGKSKLANILFTMELTKRLEDAKISNIKAVVAHPGMTYSDMGDKFVEGVFPTFMWAFLKKFLQVIPTQETEMGALPILYAATVDDVSSGEYFGPADYVSTKGLPVKEIPAAYALSEEAMRKLWELSEELTKTTFSMH